MLALLAGTLEGGRSATGQYCVWAVHSGHKVPVVWPAGFRARLHPLEVLNAHGAVFARAGQTFGAPGGLIPVNPRGRCMLAQANAFYVNSEIATHQPPST